MIQKGYFVIADITGYTAFLTGSELDHAQDILKQLFDTLLDNFKPPLRISNFQGDAILSYVPDGSILQGQTLLETIENLYCSYMVTLEAMQRHTTCTCRACSNMQGLDLKVFIHHGEYMMADMRGKQELSGSDVIIVHRMTKNRVKEQAGVKAYGLFTKAAIEAMGLTDFAAEMTAHAENYEHIGDVNMHVYDLRKVWTRYREDRRVVVEAGDSWLKLEADLPVPPSLVWDYVTEPEHFRRWCHADSLYRVGQKNGRTGVGSVNHCAHGKEQVMQTIVGWRPFEFVTLDHTLPMKGVGRYSFSLIPTAEGTRVSIVFSRQQKWPNLLLSMLMRFMIQNMMKGTTKKQVAAALSTIREMIDEDMAAGKLFFLSPTSPTAEISSMLGLDLDTSAAPASS